MDTITCSINGQTISLSDNGTLVMVEIELTNQIYNYKTTSDFDGQFKFNHIASGTYNLSAHIIGHRPLKHDSLFIGIGQISQLKIGLGSLGQDDFKRKLEQ